VQPVLHAWLNVLLRINFNHLFGNVSLPIVSVHAIARTVYDLDSISDDFDLILLVG
jgi:hypothetical protein